MAATKALLEATEKRGVALGQLQAQRKTELEALNSDIAAKGTEKTIAAQDAIKELRKSKDKILQELRPLDSACNIISKALAKLKRTEELGLSDWSLVHEETIKLSDYVLKRLKTDPKAMDTLKTACGSASLIFNPDERALQFEGVKDDVTKLRDALTALESDYEDVVETDDTDTVQMLEQRGQWSSLAKKHDVKISSEGNGLRITGPPKAVDAAAKAIQAILSGREDVDCPKQLCGPAQSFVKDVEADTGAIISVWRTGGWGGGGVIYIRGLELCVTDAREKVREWLDQKEAATSEFVKLRDDTADWPDATLNQLWNDMLQMGQKFGVVVRQRTSEAPLEIRGKEQQVADAIKELHVMLGWYKKTQAEEKLKAMKAEEPAVQEEEDDGWGAAPMAEPTPSSWG